ncbi:hypothetical protein COO60DRAFT_1463834 [Scenedesmus sp. NREL 46B-D3]|nr:hypothetical protein COO60DRAFT_1463834 [Scenedesmus sp. NREL 46B-D3]
MAATEQELICIMFGHLQTSAPAQQLPPCIQQQLERFPSSCVLKFYLGFHHERLGQADAAAALFRQCIGLEPLFLPPYYHLCSHLLGQGCVAEAVEVCSGILCKPVLVAHPMGASRATTKFDVTDHLRLCAMFSPHLQQGSLYTQTIRMFGTMHRQMLKCKHPGGAWDVVVARTYAHVLLVLTEALLHANPEQARSTCLEGYHLLQSSSSLERQQLLVVKETYYMTDQFCATSDIRLEPDDIEPAAAAATPVRLSQVQGRIRLGYLSPDFNRNAVGMFLAPLLSNFDRSRFDVHCFHYGASDQYTPQFEQAPGIAFHRLDATLSDAALAAQIMSHGIHVVVDLLARGTKNRFGVVQCLKQQQRAPLIINYLGYPASGMSNAYDYRITDSLCDPLPSQREPHLRLCSRPFVCWSLFQCERLPPITSNNSSRPQLRIGIFNRSVKHHRLILAAWQEVARANPHAVLCIKRDERMHDLGLYEGFPQGQLQFLPFMHTLQEYLEALGSVDVCADTFPYSGTTTTCTALAMGVPVISVYDPMHNRHLSNVSGSIIKSMGREEWLCADLASYARKLSEFEPLSIQQRQAVRQQFLEAMEPEGFMREFEKQLLLLLQQGVEEEGNDDVTSQ